MTDRAQKENQAGVTRVRLPGLDENPFLWIPAAFMLLLLAARLSLSGTEGGETEIVYTALLFAVLLLPVLAARYAAGIAPGSRTRGEDDDITFAIRPANIPMLVYAFFALAAAVVLLHVLLLPADSQAQPYVLYGTFTAANGEGVSHVLYLSMAFVLLPAIGEEILFQGCFCRTCAKVWGKDVAWLTGSLFYGFLCGDVRKYPAMFLTGLCLLGIMYITRSRLSSLLIRIALGFFGLYGQVFMETLYFETTVKGIWIVVCVSTVLIFSALFCWECHKAVRRRAKEEGQPGRKGLVRTLPGRAAGALWSWGTLADVLLFVILALTKK